MSIFASAVTSTTEIPDSGGKKVTARKLSARQWADLQKVWLDTPAEGPFKAIEMGVVDVDGEALTAAQVLDLTDEAVDFMARQVLTLTKPEMFSSADEKKAAQKND